MPAPLPKTPFRCPECGFVQLEPPHLVSTNCRSCGAHYEAAGAAAGEVELPVFAGGKPRDEGKAVHCLKCGRVHRVAKKAQSTICPGCYAPIELVEVAINGPSSRAVDTRGHLKLGPKGSLLNDWVVCGTARLEGAFAGHVRCEGEARLALRKPVAGRLTAGSVLVEKKTAAEFSKTVEADEFSVRGTLAGPVLSRGCVRVLGGGRCEGTVEARALVVEKGGSLVAECRIVPTAGEVAPQGETAAEDEKKGIRHGDDSVTESGGDAGEADQIKA